MGLNNYPPGVTGFEFAISGPENEWEAEPLEPCNSCGHLDDLVIYQYHRQEGAWWFCPNCDATNDLSAADLDDLLGRDYEAEEADRRMDLVREDW